MNKLAVLSISLTVVLIVAYLTLSSDANFSKGVKKSEIGMAVNQARYVYGLRKEQSVDFSRGPCLSNALAPNWVLDIVHSPRQDIDDLPENMCPTYLEGKAQHVVELDPDGNLIRAR